METATKTCPRCKGTGRKNCGVVHLGVPGLCYRCDGRGELKWVAASEVAKGVAASVESHKQEMLKKAAYITAKIERTKSEILKARYAVELQDLRQAWKDANARAADAQNCKGEWR